MAGKGKQGDLTGEIFPVTLAAELLVMLAVSVMRIIFLLRKKINLQIFLLIVIAQGGRPQ